MISTKISHDFKCLNRKILLKVKIRRFIRNCICEPFIVILRKQNLNEILEMLDFS